MRDIQQLPSSKNRRTVSNIIKTYQAIPIMKIMRMSLLVACCFAFTLFAVDQVCKFTFTACPESFSGDTLDVPPSVVALSQYIYACKSDSTISGGGTGSGGVPSIMFVIDNSGSMKNGSNPNDPDGSRFTVTTALLDTIFKHQPNAEVGLTVFREHLFFDTASTEYYADYFKTYSTVIDSEPDQAYLPFIRLNQTYGTRTGIQIIKDILATNSTGDDLLYQPSYRNLRPNNGGGETNINGAFIAVKQAFAAAKNPKERQFTIFLSDGLPAGNTQAGLPDNYYEGGDSVPTTFTVFFTSSTTAPASLRTMTNNIAANGYSTSNPSSNLWAIATSFNALMSLIMDNIMGSIFFSKPNSISITGMRVSDTSTTYVNSYFVFTDPVPLQPVITPFDLHFNFQTYDQSTGLVRDTTVSIIFHVQRDPAASNTAPQGMEYVCWPRPTLQFVYGGQSITEVTTDMTQIDVRFFPGDPRTTAVTTPVKSSIDSESVVLTSRGTYWSGTFLRDIGTTGNPNNGTLVHRDGDSIIVTYRNPLLPLDTVRLSVPVIPDSGRIPVTATLRDTSGDGHLDRIDLTWNDTSSIKPTMPSIASFIAALQLTLPNGTPVTLSAVAIVPDLANKTIHVILRENAGGPLETEWQRATVRLGTVPMSQNGKRMYVTRVLDGAGPVIERIEYRASRGTGGDSLRVIFSEPVNCQQLTALPPESLFIYYDKSNPAGTVLNGSTYAGTCPTTFVREVTIVLKATTFRVTPWEDRIGLPGGSISVADSAGNHPPANGKSVAIEGGGKNSIELTVSPNPASPNREIDSRVRQAYANIIGTETKGMIISIYSKIPLKPISTGPQGAVYGTADLYDAVGNLVQSKLPVKAASEPGVYGVYWSIRNRNTRIVGNGIYLAMVTTTAVTGEKLTKRIKLGVQQYEK
jgi:hypothetical protein